MTEEKSAHANAADNSTELERLDALALVLERSASWFPQASESSAPPAPTTAKQAEPTRANHEARTEPAFATPTSATPPPASERAPHSRGKKGRRELTRNQRALAAKRAMDEKRERKKRRAERRAERLAKRSAASAPPSRPTSSKALASASPVRPPLSLPTDPLPRGRALSPGFVRLLLPLLAALLVAWALLRR
ncbi:MAG TPA: hypothetical protein VG937_12660 [Polyangiaceae bacterium]|nr:hypothetical protein [Polyangiaceae bacterium]